MKSDFEKKLKNKAFEYGKKQIEERCFSLAIVNSEFKKMIDTYKITQESKVFSKLNKAFLEGQKFAMQSKYKEALKDLPEEIIKKYGNSINYNINEEEFDNFYELDSKLQLIKKIPEIENIKSGIKVLVFWSESEVIKDNQVLSIERFKSDCDFGLINLRAKQEKEGIYGTYDKTKYMFIFDDGKGQVITTNAIRYDIGDYKNFEDYLNRGFSNKNIPKLVKQYLGINELKEEEEEEVLVLLESHLRCQG